MCGRYSVLTEDEIIEVRSIIQEVSMRLVRDGIDNYMPPPVEIKPTDTAPIVTGVDGGIAFESAKFGFKSWNGKGVIINARAETIDEKSMFKRHVHTGRCVIPAGEYYEWQIRKGPKEKKKKHAIKDREGKLLFFAGLYRDYEGCLEFVIITRDAAGEAARVHDRMPVILRVDQIEGWLSGAMNPNDLAAMEFDAAAAPCEEPGDEDDGQVRLF